MLNALNESPPVSVRVNPSKITLEKLQKNFGDNVEEPVKWAADEAFYLCKRSQFTLDPLFHAGAYYVQEASSMYIGTLLNKIMSELGEHRLKVLDLCAAPGGKSTQILSKLPIDSLLVTNEVIRNRASVLAENIAKWGKSGVAVTGNDPSDFGKLPNFFDIVLTDVPCSGEGMFRKNADAMEEWSIDNVKLCAARQRRIVSDIWGSLKAGGYLIYSTCTFNKFENSDNIEWICTQLGGEIIETRQFLPGQDKGEGFFCSLIRKNGNWTNSRFTSGVKGEKSYCQEFIRDGYQLSSMGEMLKAYPAGLHGEIQFIEQKMRVIRSGIAVATRKGKDFIPEADLALSEILRREFFNQAELTHAEALQFLAKEKLDFNRYPLGYLLLNYQNIPLGFVKNLGTRSNNLHPSARRIRMSISDQL